MYYLERKKERKKEAKKERKKESRERKSLEKKETKAILTSYLKKIHITIGELLTLNLTGNKTVKQNDDSMLKLFEEQIDTHWIDLVYDLSASHYNFVRLSNFQDFLFDRYMERLDGAIETALNDLGKMDDKAILVGNLQKAADNVSGIYHQFRSEIFANMRDILVKADSNDEVMVAFYVLYTVYAEMQDDKELRFQISGYNPLFYKTLQDFTIIYAEAVGMPLPLTQGFLDGLEMFQNPNVYN